VNLTRSAFPSNLRTFHDQLKDNSSIWAFLENKEKKYKADYSHSRLAAQLVPHWALITAALCCAYANLCVGSQNTAMKLSYLSRIESLFGQEIGMYDLQAWSRQMDFNQDTNVTFPSVSYSDFTSVNAKAVALSNFIQNDQSIASNLQEYVHGTTFPMEVSLFLKSIASAFEFNIQHYRDNNTYMLNMVANLTDYAMSNWKEASETAIDQIKGQFYSQYIAQKDTFTSTYLALFLTKCLLNVCISTLFVVFDRLRVRRKARLLNSFLSLSEADATTALTQVNTFSFILQGIPSEGLGQ